MIFNGQLLEQQLKTNIVCTKVKALSAKPKIVKMPSL